MYLDRLFSGIVSTVRWQAGQYPARRTTLPDGADITARAPLTRSSNASRYFEKLSPCNSSVRFRLCLNGVRIGTCSAVERTDPIVIEGVGG